MKVYTQVVSVDAYNGIVKVTTFYNAEIEKYGVEIFYYNKFVEFLSLLDKEPLPGHLLALAHCFAMMDEGRYSEITSIILKHIKVAIVN